MREAMRHRGPDDESLFVTSDRTIGLTNRRLAIRDLSPAGRMPMSNADGTAWITYNGEIYNADELRSELQALGHHFTSRSDTEVILVGYEAWGDAIVRRLRGMFALAILDLGGKDHPASAGPRTRRLFLARDRLGIKPLYYAWREGAFLFASECRAMLVSGLVDREVSPAGLLSYLRLGCVPAPLTIYRGIRALESAHTLSVPLEPGADWPTEPARYWDLPRATAAPLEYPEAVERVREQLRESVRCHMISDVPVGAFLSGGVDSSAVVALMREVSPSGPIRTCSVVFAEPAYSEASYASQVARHFGTDHREIPVTAADVEPELDRVLRALDQPTHDGVNTYFVSKAARETGLKVALSGLGGDELFGGYRNFRRLATVQRLARLGQTVPGGLRVLRAGFDRWRPHHPASRLAGWLDGQSSDVAAAYVGLRGLFSPSIIGDLVHPEVLGEAAREFGLLALIRRDARLDESESPWDMTSRLELTCYMRHQLLRDTDVMSMAHSLEVRVPLVDHVLVEQVLRLPIEIRRRTPPKKLLRQAVCSLPATIRDRRGKQGFSFPFDIWLAGPLRGKLEELVEAAGADLSDLFQKGACRRVLNAFDEGRTSWSRPWALAALHGAAMS